MNQSHDPAPEAYPIGRGYGHDYMRGGEVLGGYGYAERDEYVKRRGELGDSGETLPGYRAGAETPDLSSDTRT